MKRISGMKHCVRRADEKRSDRQAERNNWSENIEGDRRDREEAVQKELNSRQYVRIHNWSSRTGINQEN